MISPVQYQTYALCISSQKIKTVQNRHINQISMTRLLDRRLCTKTWKTAPANKV